MRTVTCPRCEKSFSEADSSWDQAASSGQCPSCGWNLDATPSEAEARERQLTGVSGWLAILAILVLVSACRIAYSTITDIGPAFFDGTCGFLISDNIALAAVIVFEGAINLLLAGYGIFVFYQFLRERAAARPHFNTWAIGSLAVILVDALLLKLVLPEQALFSPETSGEIARAAVFAAVWISYLHVSVRARNTLVR